MQFLVTTTGLVSQVIFNDLAGRTLLHPTIDLDFIIEFSIEELRASVDIQNAIDASEITVKDEFGTIITNVKNSFTGIVVSGGTNTNISGTNQNPTVNVNNSVVFDSISADTMYSGSADVGEVFVSKSDEKYTTSATMSDGVLYFDRTDSMSAYTIDIGVMTADTVSYQIWAEEGSALSNNNRQWSFGNGATGVINIYAMYGGEITKIFLQAETEGTTATIDLMINNAIAGTGSFSSNGIYTFPSPISVLEGDEIGFRTNTVVGTWSDCRTGVAITKELSGIKGSKGDKGEKGDDGIPFSGGVASFFDGYESLGGTSSITTAWSAPISIDSQRKISSEYSHNISLNNSEVIINKTSTYFVFGRVSAEGSTTSRTQGECRLEVFSGGSWSEVPGTTAEIYMRQTGHGATGSFATVLDLQKDWRIRMNMRRTAGSSTMTTTANGSSLSIVNFKGPKGDKGDVGSSTGITHDRQEKYSTVSTSTISTTPVNLSDMSIITKNLGGPVNYDVKFTASRSNSVSNSLNLFYIYSNGVEVSQKRASTYTNEIHTITLLAQITGVTSGTEIKIMYDAQGGGTNTVYERTLNVDGILDDNVKQ